MVNGAPDSSQSPELFLSYNRVDNGAVTEFNRLLKLRGIGTFFDVDRIKRGELWFNVLEQALRNVKAVAVFLGRGGLGPWQRREVYLSIDRQVDQERNGQPFFPIIPIVLNNGEPGDLSRGFLSLSNWIDLRQIARNEDAIEEIVRAIRDGSASTDGKPAVCPYLGLNSFSELDAPLHYGREEYADELVSKVQFQGLTAVVGASGSGKSSLVFAGLVPRLRKERQPAWEVLAFVPGEYPWRSMADAFLEFFEPGLSSGSFQVQADALASPLKAGEEALLSSVRKLLKLSSGSERLLIVVAQFEELLTKSREEFRSPFVAALLEASRSDVARIILTLRADYYAQTIALDREFTECS
jgi:hypothetical protein